MAVVPPGDDCSIHSPRWRLVEPLLCCNPVYSLFILEKYFDLVPFYKNKIFVKLSLEILFIDFKGFNRHKLHVYFLFINYNINTAQLLCEYCGQFEVELKSKNFIII